LGLSQQKPDDVIDPLIFYSFQLLRLVQEPRVFLGSAVLEQEMYYHPRALKKLKSAISSYKKRPGVLKNEKCWCHDVEARK
jgi:hypothetical protein